MDATYPTGERFDTMTVQKGLANRPDAPLALLQIVLSLVLLATHHPFFIAFGFLLLLALAHLPAHRSAWPGHQFGGKHLQIQSGILAGGTGVATEETLKMMGKTAMPWNAPMPW